ncbi:MAG: hypothetical protein LUF86_03430 [Clostridiales bacterium]|nr:hypothetical protein [Clostridiales bacterium]
MKRLLAKRSKLGWLLGGLLLLVLLCGVLAFSVWHPARLNFDQSVLYIEVRHEDKTYTMTDEAELSALVEQLNGWDLRRGEQLQPYSGWTIILDVYTEDREKPLCLTFHGEGFDYNNYLYCPKDGEELETLQAELLALFA